MNIFNTIAFIKTICVTVIIFFSFLFEALSFSCLPVLQYADTCIRCETANVTPQNESHIESASPLLIKYALLLDTTIESVSNTALYSLIDEWIGVPYKYGGADKSGIDCSSFVTFLYQKIYNIQLPRTSRDQSNLIDPRLEEDLKEGDLVFFRTNGKGISHVGVFVGNRRFIHASTIKGVTIDSLDYPYYLKRFVFGGKIREDRQEATTH